MSIGYYSQDEEHSPHWEENPNNRLVCPECGCDVHISEGGEVFYCRECDEEGLISTLSCRTPIESGVDLNK